MSIHTHVYSIDEFFTSWRSSGLDIVLREAQDCTLPLIPHVRQEAWWIWENCKHAAHIPTLFVNFLQQLRNVSRGPIMSIHVHPCNHWEAHLDKGQSAEPEASLTEDMRLQHEEAWGSMTKHAHGAMVQTWWLRKRPRCIPVAWSSNVIECEMNETTSEA